MARENRGWGYDRIVGALANLGSVVSDQTVGNILKRHGIAPAPKRSQTVSWRDFIASHMEVLVGTDFFTVEILTWRGLVTYYVLFFLKLEAGGSKSRGSRGIRMKNGCSRSDAQRRRNLGDTSMAAVTCFTTGIPNSATRSDPW